MAEDEPEHIMFLGIRVFEAAICSFKVPEGSTPKPCARCTEAVWVQASFFEAIKGGRPHTILCYPCARRMKLMPGPKDTVRVAPEAEAEVRGMMRDRRQ